MILTLDGSSENVAHAERKMGLIEKKNTVCECSRFNLIP